MNLGTVYSAAVHARRALASIHEAAAKHPGVDSEYHLAEAKRIREEAALLAKREDELW